jgi:hypothetical protein
LCVQAGRRCVRDGCPSRPDTSTPVFSSEQITQSLTISRCPRQLPSCRPRMPPALLGAADRYSLPTDPASSDRIPAQGGSWRVGSQSCALGPEEQRLHPHRGMNRDSRTREHRWCAAARAAGFQPEALLALTGLPEPRDRGLNLQTRAAGRPEHHDRATRGHRGSAARLSLNTRWGVGLGAMP